MNPKLQCFKLNEDDILGIISDYLSEQVKFQTFNSSLKFIENEDNEIRIIAAYGELDDESIYEIDIEELDKILHLTENAQQCQKNF